MSEVRAFVLAAFLSSFVFVVVCALALLPLKAFAADFQDVINMSPGSTLALGTFDSLIPPGHELSEVTCTLTGSNAEETEYYTDGCGTFTPSEFPLTCQSSAFYLPPAYETTAAIFYGCQYGIWTQAIPDPPPDPPPDPGTAGADTVIALQAIGVILCFGVLVHGVGFGNRW